MGRTDDGDLNDQVVEAAGLEPWQHGHLRAALDLKHAHGVGAAQHLVHRGVFGRNCGQAEGAIPVLFDQLKTLSYGCQHAEREQIDLHKPTVSMSFLSHWMTVRSFMVAGSMGHKSMRGPSEIVKPPLWMPTWRGMPRMSSAI